MAMLKPFFEYCVSNKLGCQRSCASRQKSAGARCIKWQGGAETPFADEEIRRMYAACQQYGLTYRHKWNGDDMADFISLSIYTGLRISDVALFHIDRMLPTGEIRIRTTKAGTHVYAWVPEWLQERIRERTYEEAACLAERETLSYERYLLDLVTRESRDRQQKRIQRLLRQSRIPAEKALANFSLKRLPPKVALLTKSLIEGEVLNRRENVLAFGNSGSGQNPSSMCHWTGADCSWSAHVLHNFALLVKDLLVAKRDLKLSRFIKKLAHFEELIIDDLGYVQQSREEMEVLFTLLAEWYERGSVLISSNLPFSKWEGIFKDPMTTAAAIDRLVHHCVILELNIPSYRVEQAKKAKEES